MNLRLSLAALLVTAAALHADPQVSSWMTTYAGKYARIYTTDANKLAGNSVTAWTNGTQNQTAPAYCGVQEISYSANWVYLRTTGLASHIMGPWYLNAAHTQVFPNQPVNRKALYRIPRSATLGAPPATKTLTGLGVIGYFVDGVAMFDSRDGFYWNGTAEAGGGGTGYWNRDAYVNEGVTFDPGLAHQEQTGNHHYHANPIALRYLLGDHVVFNTGTKTYSESTDAVTKHSPILGWVRDGYPIYGPYGYGTALNAASPVRRMVSGYALRNGGNGTDNLTSTGRTSIPAWAQRAYNTGAAQSGPAVNTTYPLGRYMEDKAYLGDLGGVQGTHFDLDEYNGRFCVTPEFPNGTYAYFVAINADGSPAYPYNIGRSYYGNPTGAAVTTIGETVTTTFTGAAAIQEQARLGGIAANGNVALTWSSVEGGTYRVEAGGDLSTWSTLAAAQPAAANAVETSYTETGAGNANARRFYKVTRTALAAYDPVTGTTGGGGNGILSVTPASGARGSTFTLTVNLDPAVNPPPVNAPVNSVTIGTTAGTNRIHVSATRVTAQFTIPAGAATGAQTVTVVFPGPPANPAATVTYTLPGGFTVN